MCECSVQLSVREEGEKPSVQLSVREEGEKPTFTHHLQDIIAREVCVEVSTVFNNRGLKWKKKLETSGLDSD